MSRDKQLDIPIITAVEKGQMSSHYPLWELGQDDGEQSPSLICRSLFILTDHGKFGAGMLHLRELRVLR